MKKALALLVLFSCFAFAATPVCGELGGNWIVIGNETCSGSIHVTSLTVQDGATLTLENADLRIDDGGLISAEPSSSLFIHDSTVEVYSELYPVPANARFHFVVDGADFEFVNSELRYCGEMGGADYLGLRVKNTNNVAITNSVFEENYEPLYLKEVHSQSGLKYGVTVHNNNFSFNDYPVVLEDSSGISFSFNNVSYCTVVTAYGVVFDGASDNYFGYNWIDGSFGGLMLQSASTGNSVWNNHLGVMEGKEHALRLDASSGNDLFNNSVEGNASFYDALNLVVVGGSVSGYLNFDKAVELARVMNVESDYGIYILNGDESSEFKDSTIAGTRIDTEYPFVDCDLSELDFTDSEEIVLDGSNAFNCSFALETKLFGEDAKDYAVKLTGSNPGLYDSNLAVGNTTAVLIDDADGAVLHNNVIEAVQGVFVNESQNIIISNSNFSPLEFNVNWSLREGFIASGGYQECTGTSAELSSLNRLSFAELPGGGSGPDYLPCVMRAECNMMYDLFASTYSFPVCGCYSTAPLGCTDDNIIQSYKQCALNSYCYGNWQYFSPWAPLGSQWPGHPNYAGNPNEHVCSGYVPQVTIMSCSDQGYPEADCLEPPQSGKVNVGEYRCQANPNKYCYADSLNTCEAQGCGSSAICASSVPDGYESCGSSECLVGKTCFKPINYSSCVLGQGFPFGALCSIEAPLGYSLCDGSEDCAFENECYCEDIVYPTCAEQNFEDAICVVNAPKGYSLCEGSGLCSEDKYCYCEDPVYASCAIQGFEDAVCAFNAPKGYSLCGGGSGFGLLLTDCALDKECYCEDIVYDSCSSQGFGEAVCAVEPPIGTELCSGSSACGDEEECYCNLCVVDSIPFIVVDGSHGVNITNSLFDETGVIIEVKADSTLVELSNGEFKGGALIYLRGNYNSLVDLTFADVEVKSLPYTGIDVLGNYNSLVNLNIPESQGLVVWGDFNDLESISFGTAGVSVGGTDYNVVDKGYHTQLSGVDSALGGLLVSPVGPSALLASRSVAYSSFNGVRLENEAKLRYLSGSTGSTNTVSDVFFADYESELQRDWNVSVTVVNGSAGFDPLPRVPDAVVSFSSPTIGQQAELAAQSEGFEPLSSGQGIADENGFLSFEVTQAVWDKDYAIAELSGLTRLLFASEEFNPYNFTASGAGFDESSWVGDIDGDGGVAIELISGSYLTCAEQGYSGSVCAESAPEGYGVCGGEPYSGEECGEALICYCQMAVQPSPSPSPQSGVFLVAIEPNRAQLPGDISIKVSLQYEGVPLCIGEDMVVSVTGAGGELLLADFVTCDPAYGLHEFTIELSESGSYVVGVQAESIEFGTATATNEFTVIAQQPVATPGLHLILALLVGFVAFYAVRKQ